MHVYTAAYATILQYSDLLWYYIGLTQIFWHTTIKIDICVPPLSFLEHDMLSIHKQIQQIHAKHTGNRKQVINDDVVHHLSEKGINFCDFLIRFFPPYYIQKCSCFSPIHLKN